MTARTDVPGHLRDLVVAVDAYRRAFADVLGLGVGELLTLAHLDHEGPQPMSLLAVRLGIGAPAGTKLVDRMQAKELVVRRPHPTDRRSALVDLTPRGRHAAALMGRLFAADVDAAVTGVPPEHLRELADLLDRVAAHLRQRAGDVNELRRQLLREDRAPGARDEADATGGGARSGEAGGRSGEAGGRSDDADDDAGDAGIPVV